MENLEEKVISAMEEQSESDNQVVEDIEEDVKDTATESVDMGEKETIDSEKERKKKIKSIISDLAFCVISFAVIFTFFKIFPPYYVDGCSMNQTLRDDAFGFGTVFFSPDYGDIVVLHGEGQKTHGSDYIKRIIGKPGDRLEITDGVVYRNGELLDEPYAYYDPDYHGQTEITQLIVLGEDEYLVMGDNRYHSSDGRVFGPISRSEMKCKMLFFLWGKKR